MGIDWIVEQWHRAHLLVVHDAAVREHFARLNLKLTDSESAEQLRAPINHNLLSAAVTAVLSLLAQNSLVVSFVALHTTAAVGAISTRLSIANCKTSLDLRHFVGDDHTDGAHRSGEHARSVGEFKFTCDTTPSHAPIQSTIVVGIFVTRG